MNPLTTPELLYLHRFFNTVAEALASRMVQGSTPSEDNLTFLLGELMDENTTARHVLGYSLRDLNSDLDGCGTGSRVEVLFQTNEHKKRFEGEVSFADLGIVFERRLPTADFVRKAVLVQAKRLFHKNGRFTLDSDYRSFDGEQLKNLDKLIGRLNASPSAYYLLYNPTAEGFSKYDRSQITTLESDIVRRMPVGHPEWKFLFHELMHELPSPYRRRLLRVLFKTGGPVWWSELAAGSKEHIDQMRDAQRELLASRPGLRVCGLRCMKKVVGRTKKPRLRHFYEHRKGEERPWFDSDCSFESFADFMVTGIVGCLSGSQKEGLVAVAEGRMPDAKHFEGEGEFPEGLGARHTLRLRLISTLESEG